MVGGLSWLESLVLDDQNLDPSEQCASHKALAGLSQLTSLECLSCVRLRSLAPLAGLTRLRRLRVCGSQVGWLAPLRELGQLRELDCSRNPIRSLRPLDGLGLEELKCYQSGLGQAEVDRFRSAHPECQVTFFSFHLFFMVLRIWSARKERLSHKTERKKGVRTMKIMSNPASMRAK